jgi:hypothetical protein
MSQDKKLQVTKTVAEDTTSSLAPNVGLTDTDGKTKVEQMARIVGAMASADQAWVSKWFTAMMSDTKGFASKGGTDNSEANKSSIDLKAGSNRIAPMAMPAKLKEDVTSLFEGEELTEEAKERFSTLFESAVNLRVGSEVLRLTEEFQEALDEEVKSFVTEEKETLSLYMDHVAETWMEDNAVAVTDALRLEIAEEALASIRDALSAANISISEEKFDALHEVTEKLKEMEEVLEAQTAENLELRSVIEDHAKEIAFDKASEGMTLVDKEKFKGLVESIDNSSVEDFEKSAKILREKHFTVAPKATTKDVLALNETKLTTEVKLDDGVDPAVAALANKMSRQSW